MLLADLSAIKASHGYVEQSHALFHPFFALIKKHGLSSMKDYFPVLR